MNSLGINTISAESVQIDVSDISGGVNIKFSGDVDMEDPGAILNPLFDKVHEGAISKNMKTVELDLKKLNFLNSSGIKAIAKWIMKLTSTQDGDKYIINIIHEKSITWQATSLPTLKFLVPGSVNIQ